MSRNSNSRLIKITELEAEPRSCWDQEANVAQVQLTAERVSHGKLVEDLGKIVEYDRDGSLASIHLPYCSEGITMKDVPEEAQERVRKEALALGISVVQD